MILTALALAPAAEACPQDCVAVEGRPGCFQCVDLGYFTGNACYGFDPCYCVYDLCWSTVTAPVLRADAVAMPEKPAWLAQPAEGEKATCGR